MAHDEKDSLAYVPWFWRDWLASDARATMTLEAQGAYRNLLDRCWGSDDCTVTADETALATLVGANRKEWARVRASVLSHFEPAGDGRITNKRLQYVWNEAVARRDRKRGGADKTNAKRVAERTAERDAKRDAKRVAERTGKRVDIVTPPSPSPSASEIPLPPSGVPPDGGTVGPSDSAKPKPVGSPTEVASKRLAKALGSSLNPCRKQVAALVGSGWSIERVEAAIATAEPGMAPWDWTKLVRGANRGHGAPANLDDSGWVAPVIRPSRTSADLDRGVAS